MPASPREPRRTVAIIILDWLVAAAGSVARALGGRDGSRAVWVAVAASLGVVAATAVSVVLVLRAPERLAPVALDPPPDVAVVEPPLAGTPGREASPASTRPAPARSDPSRTTPSTRPSATPAPSSAAAPTRPALTAAFAVTDTALLSYRAAVTIGNPGSGPVPSWTLVITLPEESTDVTAVEGARVSRDGATWTFVPDGPAGQVPGQGSVRVSFRVADSSISSLPTACAIDGAACTGLSD
ncbi:cellulose binding domain-containing protein [Micromonospora sp. H33]|uniref:cellulose binding domain-containing protein n=1 Tax=Micromonospora sp. H33 TaxID=3452215 RepID=UPI003F89F3E0